MMDPTGDLRSNHALVRDASAHTRNQEDAASLLEANHLASNSLGRDKDTSEVDAHHVLDVLGGVIQSGRLVVDTSSSDQAIQSAVLVRDALDDGVEGIDIPHVHLVVRQRSAELLAGASCDLKEFRLGVIFGRGKSIEGMDY